MSVIIRALRGAATRRPRLAALAVLALLAIPVVAGLASAQGQRSGGRPQALPSLSVSPTVVPPDRSIGVSGPCAPSTGNYSATLAVMLSDSSGDVVAQNSAATTGPTASMTLYIPWDSTPGAYTVTATCEDYTTMTEFAPVVITVTAPAEGATHTTLTSTPNPSAVNEPVTFTAHVTGTSGVPDTGTVTFTAWSFPQCVDVPVVSGVATCTIPVTISATIQFAAQYNGGAGFLGSTSQPYDQVVTNGEPTTIGTTTTVWASPNPVALGGTVTIHARVEAVNGSSTPTGVVGFFVNGAFRYVTVLDANGYTAWQTDDLNLGPNSVTAFYEADTPFEDSSSDPITVNVECDRMLVGSASTVIARSGTTCIRDAQVSGSITAIGGGSVVLLNSTVRGAVTSSGGSHVRICGSTIQGSIVVTRVTGDVRIGDPDAGCAGNHVTGSIIVQSSTGGGTVAGNHYGGTVLTSRNRPGINTYDNARG